MDSGRKANLCHGEHVRVHRMSCRLLEGFTLSSAGLTGKGNLEAASYLLVLLTGLAGMTGTYLWWRWADQNR